MMCVAMPKIASPEKAASRRNIYLDNELAAAGKKLAVQSGYRSFSALLAELLTREIARPRKPLRIPA
jgi:hypothetical protein